MIPTLCLLAVAAFFVIRVCRTRRRRLRERASARAQLRTAIYAACVAADQAQANRRND